MVWIGRKYDRSLYGLWSTPQPDDEFHTGLELIADDHPDVIAFLTRPQPVVVDPRDLKIADLESRLATLELKSIGLSS